MKSPSPPLSLSLTLSARQCRMGKAHVKAMQRNGRTLHARISAHACTHTRNAYMAVPGLEMRVAYWRAYSVDAARVLLNSTDSFAWHARAVYARPMETSRPHFPDSLRRVHRRTETRSASQ